MLTTLTTLTLTLLLQTPAKTRACKLEDQMNFRTFDLSQFEDHTQMSSEFFAIDLCSPIPNSIIEQICEIPTKAGKPEQFENVFFIKKWTNDVISKCTILTTDDIDYTKFDRAANQITIYVSEIGQKTDLQESLAVQIHLFVRNSSITEDEIIWSRPGAEDPYLHVYMQIPPLKAKPVILQTNWIFTSSAVKLTFFTIPRLILFLVLFLGSLCLTLDLPKIHFPLYHIMFAFNMLTLFLALEFIFEIPNEYITGVMLLAWIVMAALSLQTLPGYLTNRIIEWTNLVIFWEIYIETIDLLPNKYIFFVVLAIALLIDWLIGMVIFRCFSRLERIEFRREVIVTALISLRLLVYLVRAGDPLRNPILGFSTFGMVPVLNAIDQGILLFLAVIFLPGFFAVRMLLVAFVKARKVGVIVVKDEGYYLKNQSVNETDVFIGEKTEILNESRYSSEESEARTVRI